jgi:hypothetical protein
MARYEKIVMGLWVGTPIAIMALIFLINPGYASYYFRGISPRTPAAIVIFLLIEALNFVALFVGFRALQRYSWRILLMIATFVLLTIPSLLIAVVWPGVFVLLATGSTAVS